MSTEKKYKYESYFGRGDNPCYGMENRPKWSYFQPSTILEILQNEYIPANDRLWAATREGILDDRTLRLFACKCVRDTPLSNGRKVWDLLTDSRSRNAVEVAERFANGQATEDELKAAREVAREAAMAVAENDAALTAVRVAAGVAAGVASGVASGVADWVAARIATRIATVEAAVEAQVAFLIEIIQINKGGTNEH